MSATHHHRKTCRLCGSTALDLALHLAPTPPADSYIPVASRDEMQQTYPLDLYLCRDCGFSQLSDIISAEAIYTEYIYETKSSLGLQQHFQGYADSVAGRIKPPEGALVIDVGSNDGTLLKSFKKHGVRVLGIDPAREIAARATEAGLETLPDFLTPELGHKIRTQYGLAAIVTANNIYANVDSLGEITDTIRSLLAPEGVFVFESFYLADLMKNMVFDFIYHEHLSYFSVKPLAAFFRRHGMELIDAERVPTKGGSLRYTIQLDGGPRKVQPAIAQLIAEETVAGVQSLDAFKDFSRRIDAAGAAARDLLAKLKSEGKRVDGYGASATTTTLLYHFGITDSLGCIYDDYPSKQHLLSPGCHIPVLPPEEIATRKPDYILIIAWRYVPPIVDKNEVFAKDGGKFIVPLPRLEVL